VGTFLVKLLPGLDPDGPDDVAVFSTIVIKLRLAHDLYGYDVGAMNTRSTFDRKGLRTAVPAATPVLVEVQFACCSCRWWMADMHVPCV
jgi:hypothetical protein